MKILFKLLIPFLKLSEKKTRPLQEIELAKMMNGIELYDDSFRRYEGLVNKFFPEEKELVDKLRISGEKLKETSSELINMTGQNVSTDQVLEKYGEFEYAEVYFLNDIDEALKHEDIEFNERNENLTSRIADSKMIILIVSISTFFIAIAVGLIVTRSISNPIDRLKNAAEDINRGNLDTRVDIRTDDEMGVLASTFNKMVHDLSEKISEHKRTVGHLEKKNAFVDTVLESLSYPFYVINVNDYTIALANSAACKKDSAVGSTCYALTHKTDKLCGIDGHICPLEEVKRTKKPVVVEHLHYDKDGNARNMEVHGYPIFDSNGNVVQVIEYSLDITERLHSQQVLKESEERFRSVAQSASDAIITSDSDGNVVFWNNTAQKMFGYLTEEVLGKPLTILMPQRYREAHLRGMERLNTTGKYHVIGKTVELQALRKDGSEIPIELSLSTWKTGEKTFYSGILRDISDRKRNEQIKFENERLELANKTKNEFLAVMSHELRTPLNAIIGFSDLLKNKCAGELNEKQKRYVDNVYSSGKHLLSIIDDILDLTRVDSGKMEIIIEKMSVPNAINKVVNLIKEKAERRNVIIKKQIGHDIEFIETESNRFSQVLNNLLDNAVKFKVSDTGIGIRDEDMGRIFQSFEQLETGKGRKYEGTGLGLAISKKLVEILGGGITVESKYGEGSTFTFYLPVHAKNKEGMT